MLFVIEAAGTTATIAEDTIPTFLLCIDEHLVSTALQLRLPSFSVTRARPVL